MKNDNQMLQVIEYVTLDINELPHDLIDSEEKLKKYLLLQAQGDSVALKEDSNLELLLYVFETIHFACPEVVLVTKDEKHYLIYDHQPGPVIRPESIIKTLCLKEEFIAKEEKDTQVHINLSDIWSSVEAASIEKAFNKAKELVHKTDSVTLTGNVPSPLLLAVYHLLYRNCEQVWYQESESSKPIRIR